MAANHVSLPVIENAIREVCFALDERSQHTLTPDVNSGHETLFMQQPALHRIAAHRQPGIGNPAVLAVFGDCRILRCIR